MVVVMMRDEGVAGVDDGRGSNDGGDSVGGDASGSLDRGIGGGGVDGCVGGGLRRGVIVIMMERMRLVTVLVVM